MNKSKPRIMFDHDSRHTLIYLYEPPMHRRQLEAAVDEFVRLARMRQYRL